MKKKELEIMKKALTELTEENKMIKRALADIAFVLIRHAEGKPINVLQRNGFYDCLLDIAKRFDSNSGLQNDMWKRLAGIL